MGSYHGKAEIMKRYGLFICEHFGKSTWNEITSYCITPECALNLLLNCASCKCLTDRHIQIMKSLSNNSVNSDYYYSKIDLLYNNFTPYSRLPPSIIFYKLRQYQLIRFDVLVRDYVDLKRRCCFDKWIDDAETLFLKVPIGILVPLQQFAKKENCDIVTHRINEFKKMLSAFVVALIHTNVSNDIAYYMYRTLIDY